jgi:hypothetical protein
MMTSAPLAMVMCNHSVTDATLGLQWHVLGIDIPVSRRRQKEAEGGRRRQKEAERGPNNP